MIDNTNPICLSTRLGGFKFVWLIRLSLVVVLAATAYWGIPEWNVALANRIRFEQWAAVGVPYDSATLQKAYNERTHPDGTSAWLECGKLIRGRIGSRASRVEVDQRLPGVDWDAAIPANLVPSGKPIDWPGEPLVASYLKEMKPAIDLIEQASSHPTPTRFPINFQGVETSFDHVQDARCIQRLLKLDCCYAYFNHDNERALRDLNLMQATVDAYDARECLLSELVNTVLHEERMGVVRQTLTHCHWSAADLEILRGSLSPKKEISARWYDVMLSERALGLSIVGAPRDKFAHATWQETRLKLFTAPSELETLLEVYQRIIELPSGADVGKWRKRAADLKDWRKTQPSNSLTAMLTPATASVLEAEIRAEDSRRWTLTAVAIQQFKQRNKQWPKDLIELESVGLNYDEYSDMAKNVFGYEIEGDKVFLWKRDSSGLLCQRISKTRPLPDVKSKRVSYVVVELN